MTWPFRVWVAAKELGPFFVGAMLGSFVLGLVWGWRLWGCP